MTVRNDKFLVRTTLGSLHRTLLLVLVYIPKMERTLRSSAIAVPSGRPPT